MKTTLQENLYGRRDCRKASCCASRNGVFSADNGDWDGNGAERDPLNAGEENFYGRDDQGWEDLCAIDPLDMSRPLYCRSYEIHNQKNTEDVPPPLPSSPPRSSDSGSDSNCKASVTLTRADGQRLTNELVSPRSGAISFSSPTSQQNVLIWTTPPKTVLILKKLGPDLVGHLSKVSRASSIRGSRLLRSNLVAQRG